METIATSADAKRTSATNLSRRACVVGLGYVGLPLAQRLRDIGWNTTGVDSSEARTSVIKALESADLSPREGVLTVTTDIRAATDCTVYFVAVPTPTDNSMRPDLEPLRQAMSAIGSVLKKGDLVVLESTVYPTVTRDVCAPLLENTSGLSHRTDFNLGYSPERINPGDREHGLQTSSKIVAGADEESAQRVYDLYTDLVDAPIHLVSSLEVAEMTKLVENTQRDVNIAFMNEVSKISDAIGIDTTELLEACATKWNFVPFEPGLVGGHCIAVDPHYLIDLARSNQVESAVISAARKTNEGYAAYLCERIIQTCRQNSIDITHADVLILGATYKPNVPDTRNSGSFAIQTQLDKHFLKVWLADPLLEESQLPPNMTRMDIVTDTFDVIILSVFHEGLEQLMITKAKKLLKKTGLLIDLTGRASAFTAMEVLKVN